MRCLLAALLSALLSALCLPAMAAEEKWPQITDLRWTEQRQQDSQRQWVDQLVREEFGEQIRQTPTDLETLQRIIYRGLIKPDDGYHLQSLGVVLGDLFVKDLGLEWKIYEDEKGRSRAACVPNTEQCLFPITMLSRRMEVGLVPDVKTIYNDARELMKPYLPKSPFDKKH